MPGDEDMRRKADDLLSRMLPQEGTLDDSMNSMHELYSSARRGGFNELQALWIVGYVVTGGQRVDTDDPPESK